MSSPAPWIDARARIEAAALVPPDNIAWPNEPFTQPNPPAPWFAVEIAGTLLDPIDIGANVWEETGILWFHVYVPYGTGRLVASTIAKNAANTFRSIPVTSIAYQNASIGLGERDLLDGNWWRLSVSIEWLYQDISI